MRNFILLPSPIVTAVAFHLCVECIVELPFANKGAKQ